MSLPMDKSSFGGCGSRANEKRKTGNGERLSIVHFPFFIVDSSFATDPSPAL
jgi:hypothetical protein